MDLRRLDTDQAFVVSDDNYLYLFKGGDPKETMLNIVHEATHVIQARRSQGELTKNREADAFLAKAIARLTLDSGKPLPKGKLGPSWDAAQIAASSVYGQVQMTDKQWQDNYQNLVKEVAKLYPDNANQRDDSIRARDIDYFDQYVRLEEVLEAINRSLDDAGKYLDLVLP